MITRKVTPSESGKRLHRFLRTLMPNIPLGQLYKMIDQGKVRVNGKRKNQNYELGAGDEIVLHVEEAYYKEASAGAAQKKPKFVGVSSDVDVVFEDAELLVANKPAGMLTHPDQAQQRDTLIGRVHAYLYRKGELDSALFLPATANRLDRNTSGLVLIGKTAGMLHQLNQWIQKREMEKYYVTLVEGRLSGEGAIEGSLVRDEKSNRTLVVGSRGGEAQAETRPGEKEATTRYKVLQTGKTYSLVEVELISGRTHQIRTHFQSIGHPLLGDIKYGGHALGTINHQLLHAWRMVLPDGREFRAPWPPLLRSAVSRVGLSLTGSSY
ncbi:RluA family pseudouridine synthase [Cohnella sp. CFH 77786]|uniref:RluA family pseudouridine synthase n=1 Tax=Cohnella sp. CFH 77786 TaxID=2662265 RepID=UPI001C60CA21|nr:RluA family pseudouridine synthase [Cohnella sp. CFH 77786]MBW5445438.1 RluA family pseudouridine synthase [Cohnella sp. CFH 77786]